MFCCCSLAIPVNFIHFWRYFPSLQWVYFFHKYICSTAIYILFTSIYIFFTATNIFLHQAFRCCSLTSSWTILTLVVCICARVWFPWTFSGKPLSLFCLSPGLLTRLSPPQTSSSICWCFLHSMIWFLGPLAFKV